jgi:hypothetical protein
LEINLKVNNIATISLVQRFKKVSYYSVTFDDQTESLFEQFLEQHTDKSREKLNHILVWIKLIGDNIGARASYFRNEAESADTSALPPKGVDREPTYVEYNEETDQDEPKANDLRLYCLRANEHVVFLFSGDIKTAATAQECDQVRPHFKLANALTKALDEAFREKEILWTEDNEDIIIDSDFIINI